MPEFISKIQPRKVFSDADPFIYEMPGVGRWRMDDTAMRPPHESDVNPNTTPVTYLVAAITNTIADEAEREPAAEAIAEAYRTGKLTLQVLHETMTEIGDVYAKHTASAATGLPTGER